MGVQGVEEFDSASARPIVSAGPVATLRPRRDDDVIDLSDLLVVMLKWAWIPVVLAAVGLYVGYGKLQGFVPQHVASMVIAPVGGAPAAPLGNAAALAGAFGIRLGPEAASASPFDRLKFLFGSVVLAERMQEKYGLMQRVYVGSWDSATQSWKRPEGPEFERDQRVRTFLRQNLWSPPNLESLATYLEGTLRVEAGPGTYYRLKVEHRDPEFALWLLRTAYTEADDLLREQDRAAAEERKAAILGRLASETRLQLQETLRGLLSAELSREITLDQDLPYTSTVIEPPRLSNRRTEPNLTVTFGFYSASLAALGMLVVLLIAVIQRERKRKT